MTNRQDNGPHRSSTMDCSLEFIKYCHIEITKPIRLDRKAPIAVPNIQINPLLALDLTSGVKGGSLSMSFTSVCFIFITPSFEGLISSLSLLYSLFLHLVEKVLSQSEML